MAPLLQAGGVMSHAGDGQRILIVDDEPDLAATWVRFFRQMGRVPLVARSGPEALALIDAERPDLVLTDLRLPGVDGLEVLRHARRVAAGTPVILVTAYASEETRREALRAGARAYLAKPVSLAELRTTVEKALATGGRTAIAPPPAVPG